MDNPKATHPYATSTTVVLWNAERCKIPSGVTASDILPRIQTSLVELGYVGPLEMTAIVANENRFNPAETASLRKSGIRIANFREGDEVLVDFIIMDLIVNDLVRVRPANVLVISGGGRFSDNLPRYLTDLKCLDINVMYAFCPEAAAPSHCLFSTTWEWLSLLKLED
ncbi:unnamed protein product [Eruca vesicaria subsp. sativa]|uniref:NYN domain-containing protein n=1 Tax=Eruca vesicaria subsp. sativa TaxID=29727 RepID=A0ABC8KD27_ERUVS|nr:unnamed protein product [Eruca vesicaria subsp. sativa]